MQQQADNRLGAVLDMLIEKAQVCNILSQTVQQRDNRIKELETEIAELKKAVENKKK